MDDEVDFQRDRALYERWRLACRESAPAPDAMALAAYIERRADADRVEAAMAADPELLALVLELRTDVAAESASPELLRRAQALIGGTVIPFRPRPAAAPATGMRRMLAWGAVAASVAAVALVGFNIGIGMEQAINAPASGAPVDLLDQTMGGGVG